MRKRKVLFICLFTLMGLILFVGIIPNYSCIKEILVQNKFQKNNGRLLLYGIASTFDTWGDNLDTSTGFKISKKCIDNLGHIDSEEFYKNIDNASKNNLIINKTNLKNSIFINQCIFLRDIKVLYITYNALFPNHNKVFKASLIDNRGNAIAAVPSFTSTTRGLLMTNFENYFWGIDSETFQQLILHVEVCSDDGSLLFEHDQLLFKTH